MSAQAMAALLLAAAVLAGPGNAVVSARLSGLVPAPPGLARPGRGGVIDGARAGRSTRLVVATAMIGVGALAMALCGWCVGALLGPPAALGMFLGCRRWLGARPFRVPWLTASLLGVATLGARLRSGAEPDPFALAGCWGLLAACLRGGLPVPVAVRLVVPELPAPAQDAMRRTAELLALGADPVQAWQPAMDCPATAELARGARRTARSGAALAGIAEGLAVEVRGAAGDLAEARAQRAAVAVTGPLGLCFLPAFLCLGVIPVVIGLATRLMSSW